MRNLSDLKEIVLKSQDKNELYEIEVELTEMMGNFHKAIRMAETTMDKGDAQAQLSLATALVGICRERQNEVGNWANKINYNFRMAARAMLTKDAYDKIWKQAQLTRNDTRDMKKELGKNRIDIN